MPRQRQHMTPEEAQAAGLFPRSILRREFRLKPAANQPSAGTVWQGQGFYQVFDKSACVPLRAYRAPSAAQAAALAAGRAAVGTIVCTACGTRMDKDLTERSMCGACIEKEAQNEVRATAAAWLAENPLFLDTETTGLGDDDQICEIAVLDAAGAVLFSSLVRPGCAMSAEAAKVHGISADDLASAPAWPAVHNQVAEILAGRLIVAHNADFDSRLLRQTCRAHGLDMPPIKWGCTMELLTSLNGGRWPRLSTAAAIAGAAPHAGRAHRAAHDADTVRRIAQALAVSADSVAR